MKKIYSVMMVAALALTFTACSDNDDTLPAKVQSTSAGTFTDPRDGQTYGWVRYGSLDWMTENYRYDAGSTECSVYLDADEYQKSNPSLRHLPKYGRLYTVKGALAACPDGWRLPTDADWQDLEQQLGMSADDAAKREWRGRIASNMLTVMDDSCALSLRLGGYYTTHTIMALPGWRFMGIDAYYWTATPDETKTGSFYFFRKLAYNRQEVYRESTEPTNYQMSVRYVRDAQ